MSVISSPCVRNQSYGNRGAACLTEMSRKIRPDGGWPVLQSGVILCVSWPRLIWVYIQYSLSVCRKKKKKKVGTNYFHVRSQAAQHPPQSARWPKPCANPRSCALMCPRKHTHTYTFAQQTLMSLTPNIYFLRRRTYTGTRLYFVHRDIRINRLVKLGLSSHIHRKHGIRCINAVCS